jgi:RNA polymerase sigma-70 factor (ECF subfamily)
MLSIARFKALSALRRRQEQELDEETAEQIEDHADDPETALAKKDKGSALQQCLARLSADHREIIDLVYYHERSVEEVAEIVGIPEATVKTRMFYARKKLSELLKEQGIDRGWP